MKRIVLAGAIALSAAPAIAADLPPPPARAPAPYVPVPAPVYNWSGFYIGVNGGYGFASGNTTVTVTSLPGAVNGTGNLSGGVAGGQIGFNWQMNSVVLGLEVDGDWSGQSKTDTIGCGIAGCSISESFKIPWFATARARAGWAFDRVLVYGTGGAAWMGVTDTLTASAGGVTATLLNVSDTPVGWTAGGGVEVAFSPNWTARAEYLFMQTKPTGTAAVPVVLGGGGTVTETATISDSIVRAGVNFKFGGF